MTMKKLRKFWDWFIPSYARLPLLIVLLFNFFAFYLPKVLTPILNLHTIHTALDDKIPLVPGFIFVYVLAFAQWGFGYIIIARDSRERCYRVLSGELISKAMSMLVFLFYATRMDRPTVEVHDFTTWFLAFIYRMDTPINLFPSLHCLESWLCFRGAIGLKRMPRWYTWFQFVFTLLVFATVLLVKQHVWPDILGGVAFAELGQLLGRLFKADRLLAKTDRSLRSHA